MRSAGLVLVSVALIGCSAEKNTALSRTWHTFVSYFNGYYHAEQRFRIAQREIEASSPDPTEGFLPVFPLIEASVARSQYTRLEEATKKCEVIIFRHKNGRYVDDCRTLIGQCWVLRSNLPSAQQNFSYVLNAFPNTPLRAKIYWWEAYAALHEENPYRAETRLTEALSLDAKKLKKYKPHVDVLLAQALIAKGQPADAVRFLERSVDRLDTRLRKARGYYLLGQLYLSQQKPDLAEAAFQKAFRLNASNALTFRSQVELSLLRSAKDPKLIRKLEKMAQSARYEDYKDQIFYRVGQLYAEQGNYEAALRAYQKAGASGQSPARALAHYEAGNIYFERLNDLNAAQKHYDTAATLIPEKHPKAAELKMLQARFREYAQLRAQMRTSDSLLWLSTLSPEERERVIEAYIQAEVSRRAAEKARQKQSESSMPVDPANPFLQQANFMGGGGAGFYFDNPMQVSNGRQEFIRLWGERPDEDHWRRRNKAALPSNQSTRAEEKTQKADSSAMDWPEDLAELTPARVKKLKEQLLATVPTSPAQKKAVEDSLIAAVLPLAQLYIEAFGRKDSAIALYRWLRQRLPHRSEAQISALYGLYVTHIGTPEAEAYKKELISQYPHCEYAKLLLSGGRAGLTSTPNIDIHQALLESYEKEEYLSVVAFGEATRDRWKGTPSEPAILYLIAAAYVHLQQASHALPLLQEEIQNYPQAPCTPLAQKLLERLQKGQTQLTPEAEPTPAPTAQAPVPSTSSTEANFTGFSSQVRPGEPILVVLLVPKDKITSDALKQHIARSHERYFGEQRLSLVVFLYNNTHHLAYVAQFSDYRSAEAYIQTMESEPWYRELSLQRPRDFFPISQANFRVAFTQKRMHDYAAFFAQNRAQFR